MLKADLKKVLILFCLFCLSESAIAKLPTLFKKTTKSNITKSKTPEKKISIEKPVNNQEEKKKEADNLNMEALTLEDENNFIKAQENFNKAYLIYKELNDKKAMANTLMYLTKNYEKQNKLLEALKKAQTALALYNELNDKYGQALAITEIGSIYTKHSQEMLKKAIKFHEKAMELSDELKDDYGKAQILSNLGDTYFALGDKKQALDFYTKSYNSFNSLNASLKAKELKEKIDSF